MTPEQPSWEERLTRLIASQVRWYRQERGLSLQQLADRCGELGLPVKKSVLANLETRRRSLVTVAELLVLAAALDVPPVELALPLGREDRTEVLPGAEVPTWDAARWFRGDLVTARRGDSVAFEEDDGTRDEAIFWLVVHDDLVRSCEADLSVLGTLDEVLADDRVSGARADGIRAFQERSGRRLLDDQKELGEHRAIMRHRGWLVPTLPPELTAAAKEEERYLTVLGNAARTEEQGGRRRRSARGQSVNSPTAPGMR